MRTRIWSTQSWSKQLSCTSIFIIMTGVLLVTTITSCQVSLAKRPQVSASLRGSSSSVDRQVIAARRAGLKRYKSRRQVLKAIKQGRLKRVRPNHYLELANVSYPYAHPKLHTLLNRLARLYYQHCRTRLVVTSLTRPINEQPRNGSKRSVHPAGIAADLRVPPYVCRKWLRSTLLSWEKQGVIEATREKRPPHFHLVAIPNRLSRTKVAQLKASSPKKLRKKASRRLKKRPKKYTRKLKKSRQTRTSRKAKTYRVKRGDSIWRLSRRWQVSEKAIKRLNSLKSSHIELGQILRVPVQG